jgi:trans-2,3-dihydro-3-hydroxyanthranilate isomerase
MTLQAGVIPSPADWHGSADLHPYFVCDVFTSEPLQGNQLGVFIDGRPFGPAQMQRLARELNVAETVFLLPPAEGGDVRIRIFTPLAELPFAGHPVLGTAFVVAAALDAEAVTLETGAGLVPIALVRDGDRFVFGWMRQPIPSWEPYLVPVLG